MAKVTAVTGEQDPTAAAIRELVQLVRVTALCVRSIHPAPNADELVGRVERGAHDRSATREGREVGVPLSVVVLSDKQVSSAVTLPRGPPAASPSRARRMAPLRRSSSSSP